MHIRFPVTTRVGSKKITILTPGRRDLEIILASHGWISIRKRQRGAGLGYSCRLSRPISGIPSKRGNSHSAILNQHGCAGHVDLRLALQTEEVRALNHALDLLPVHLDIGQLVKVCVRDVEQITAGVLDEIRPNLLPGRGGEIPVGEVEVDAGLERGVDGGHAVRGQEADSGVVLELGEEPWRSSC